MHKLIVFFLFLTVHGFLLGHPPVGIVMDSKGNIFYTDLTHVWKISTIGKRTIAVKDVHTHMLYIDSEDNLFGEHEWYKGEITDTWGNYVWQLSSTGKFSIIIPDSGKILENNTLIRDSSGSSYWVRNRQQIYRHDTNKISTKYSDYNFNNIRWMHYSTNNNNLYVVDKLSLLQILPSGNVYILKENLKEPVPPFNNVSDHHYLFGVCTDKKDNAYIAVFGARKVKKIDTKGNVVTVYKSKEDWSPSGVFVAPNSDLWVLEFSKQGKTKVSHLKNYDLQKVYQD